jgi:hypothetical protein
MLRGQESDKSQQCDDPASILTLDGDDFHSWFKGCFEQKMASASTSNESAVVLTGVERFERMMRAFREPGDPLSPWNDWWETLVRAGPIPFFHSALRASASHLSLCLKRHFAFGTTLADPVVAALQCWPPTQSSPLSSSVAVAAKFSPFAKYGAQQLCEALAHAHVDGCTRRSEYYSLGDMHNVATFPLAEPFVDDDDNDGGGCSYEVVQLTGHISRTNKQLSHWVTAYPPRGRRLRAFRVADLYTFFHDCVGLYHMLNNMLPDVAKAVVQWVLEVDKNEAAQTHRYLVARSMLRWLTSNGIDGMSPSGAALSVACRMCIQADEGMLTEHQERHL